MAELDGEDVVPVVEPSPMRRELWISFVAAVFVILLVAGGLLAVTAELRAGWVSDHEQPMDKTTAVHNLLFRP